ncbi:MAG TPA: DsbA family protein [Acidimicrobiales bacterium]|jgi:predicted DsbA family dithiol-disulfide isomerase
MTVSFAVTWDYRCPFARNIHEHLLTALEGSPDWEVKFAPFSLGQAHVAEGEADVWDEPEKDTGIMALQAGVVVRDRFPEQFPAVHRALFAARHDDGLKLQEEDVVRSVLTAHGVDADEVFAAIEDGTALKQVRAEHEAVVGSHKVWGVPTFISGDEAVFVRVMDRAPAGSDPAQSQATIERIVELLDGWPNLNEFKHTSIKR